MAIDPKAFGLELVGGASPADGKPFEEKDGVALLQVEGPLVSAPHFYWQDYQSLERAAALAFKSKAEAVGLCIDSPGGAAAGCFEFVRALRGMSKASGKPLGVFITGQACSAAFCIASAATPGLLWAPPTSQVGNIAVFEALVDATGADAQMGLKFAFVVSEGADLKLAGNPHVALTDAVVEHVQTQVDILTNLFDEVLQEMRGIPPAQTRALRGAALLAVQGVEKGLVDAVGTYGAFLAQLSKGKPMATPKTPAAQASKATDEEWSALRTMAESDDEEKRKMAKKLLGSMMGESGEGGGESDEDKKKKDEETKAKAEKEDADAKAKAAASAPAAQASTGDVALAQRLHAIEVERAAEKDASKRAELLAKRPDFSSEVRATLASASLDVLEKAVATWPRVNVSPTASAAASTPGVTPGQHDGAQKTVSPEQAQLLERIGRNMGPRATAARSDGTQFVLEPMTAEAASKRMKEMTEQGIAPRGAVDFARVANTEFKTPGK